MSEIKLVCFDLNKTLVNENTWYELNLAMGVTPEQDESFFNEYRAGRLSYEDWQKELLKIYLENPNANRDFINKVVSQYSFKDGAREIVAYLKSKGYQLALISGSMNILVDLVAKDLDIHLAEATDIILFDDEDRLRDFIVLGDDKIAKLNLLESFCQKLGIELTECVCVGDGDNDVELFRKTGKGITFTNSPIAKEAWKVIDNLADLKTIL
jgi:phosphoserine phosphatase